MSIDGLTVRFGQLTALDAVSLKVRPGEIVALAGENGAGKTTLIRSVGGDLTPTAGAIRVGGRVVAPDPVAAAKLGIRIVWQDLALADNLDVASNVMLGNERWRHLLSDVWMHKDARALFRQLSIPLQDTTRSVRLLSGGQRQMVAVARAMAHKPRLLMLDEPTASLGVRESALVEQLITRLRDQGTTVVLSCHDIPQMFRLADRIVVLRHGKLIREVSPSEVHPDDVVALVSGQKIDSSARRQLTRLHRLAGRLTSSDPSSSLSLILSALGAALGSERLCIHLPEAGDAATPGGLGTLACAASFGVPETLLSAWSQLPVGAGGGPVGLAAANGRPVIEDNIRAAPGSWAQFGDLARAARVASSWSVPVLGPGGLLGVITVFRSITGKPQRDDLDLATLYAGYAASAIERDRLLEQVTARNRVLETIREVLQSLASAVPVSDGLMTALGALRHGLEADEVALVTRAGGASVPRAYSAAARPPAAISNGVRPAAPGAASPGPAASGAVISGDSAPRSTISGSTASGSTISGSTISGSTISGRPGGLPAGTLVAAESVLARAGHDGVALPGMAAGAGSVLSVTFTAPQGRTVLLACWHADGEAGPPRPGDSAMALVEDAAHSIRLALERESATAAHQEAMALRQSQEMQHAFLRRLSHELRTPLTAITGFASSLLQKDVTWDAESQHRFLSRISAESSRLGRLVNDLLDFSAIESGIFRLQGDWCDLPLVIDAAVALLPPASVPFVTVATALGLPQVWADHDRLEQVFVNLLGNALGHNPPGTRVTVTAEATVVRRGQPGTVTVRVADDGEGMPPELMHAPVAATAARRPHRRGDSGAGLGLSIAKGIVAAHGGTMDLEQPARGTSFLITLPVERPGPPPDPARPAGTPRPAQAPPPAGTVPPTGSGPPPQAGPDRADQPPRAAQPQLSGLRGKETPRR
ncbi:MAG TPA: ATP-binding cassette domain-containing protein [Trebonia sp.]|nr:ATP-binding cassette domain-containing protein [Trebonia sp.]